MLALLPQTLTLPGGGTASGWYIYALATDPGRAARATAGNFSRFVDGYLAERGADCVTTVPAEQACSNSSAQWALRPAFPPGSWSCSSMLQPAAEGDRARTRGAGGVQRHPAPAGGGPPWTTRRSYPLPAGHGPPVGGGLYRLSVDGAEDAPPPSTPTGRVCCSRRLLLSPDKMGRGLAALEQVFPGARCYVRHPCPVGWHEG